MFESAVLADIKVHVSLSKSASLAFDRRPTAGGRESRSNICYEESATAKVPSPCTDPTLFGRGCLRSRGKTHRQAAALWCTRAIEGRNYKRLKPRRFLEY